jgi:hypothetical protein
LDDALVERGVDRVDFIKSDAEGVELSVPDGAPRLLQWAPREIVRRLAHS